MPAPLATDYRCVCRHTRVIGSARHIARLPEREKIAMATPTVKEAARQLIERLPDGATWDDLEYEIYVRRVIDAGIADSDAGDVVPVAEVRMSFGLPE